MESKRLLSQGRELLEAGALEGALPLLNKATIKNPVSSEGFCLLGIAKSRMGQHEAAAKDFTKAINLRPGYAEAFLGRAEAYKALGYRAGVVDDLTEAARLLPDPESIKEALFAAIAALEAEGPGELPAQKESPYGKVSAFRERAIMREAQRRAGRTPGLGDMVFGAVAFAAGIAITGITFYGSSQYIIVAFGPVGYGVYKFNYGLHEYLNHLNRKKHESK